MACASNLASALAYYVPSLLIILLQVWPVACKYAFNSPKYVFIHPAPVREKEFDLDDVVLKAASDFHSRVVASPYMGQAQKSD
jgi:hypothetical protein